MKKAEELLRRPEVDLLGYAVGIYDSWPKFLDVRSPFIGISSAGVATIDLLERGLDVLPIAGLHRGEKPFNVLGDLIPYGIHFQLDFPRKSLMCLS